MGNSIHARDAFAMSLDYFNGDYRQIGNTQVTYLAAADKNLYNGNIARSNTAITPFANLSTKYNYDQLNRLKKADYSTVDAINHTLAGISDYSSRYRYDADGNLLALQRKGNDLGSMAQMMDSFRYYYEPQTNRLRELTDQATDVYANDIKRYTDSTTSRYLYDATGNMIKDMASGLDLITWTPGNKVRKVENHTARTDLRFVYDGSGNRIAKYYKQMQDTGWRGRNEYYVRAADGNILAIYREDEVFKTTRVNLAAGIHTNVKNGTNRNVLIDVVTDVMYPDAGFSGVVINRAVSNPGISGGMMGNYPISFYTSQSAAVRTNMLVATSIQFLFPLFENEQAGDNLIVGPAVYKIFEDADEWLGTYIAGHYFRHDSMYMVETPFHHLLGQTLQHFLDANPDLLYGLCYRLGYDPLPTDSETIALIIDQMHLLPAGDIYGWLQELQILYPEDFRTFIHTLMGDYELQSGYEYYYNTYDLYSGPLMMQTILTYHGNMSALDTFYDGLDSSLSFEVLHLMNTPGDLLSVHYQSAPGAFTEAVMDGYGDAVLDTLVALSEVDIYQYAKKLRDVLADGGYPPFVDHWEYVTKEQSRHYYLSDHVLYGSSRLGLKKYWPLQYYTRWSDTGTTAAVIDTGHLNIRHPWYSYAYNDAIRDTMRTPVGGTATHSYALQHQIGQRQYELTNHLGNVQATVSDNRVEVADGTDTIRKYKAMVASAYDYYPFGMLMPGRYVEDTSEHCYTVTQTKLLPYWEYTPLTPINPNGRIILGPGTDMETREDGSILLKTNGNMGSSSWMPEVEFWYEFDVEPNIPYDVLQSVSVKFGQGPSMNAWMIPNSSMQAFVLDSFSNTFEDVIWDYEADTGYVTVYFNVESRRKVYLFFWLGYLQLNTDYFSVDVIRHKVLKYKPGLVTAWVCNDNRGDYRFGFNGMFKDNEVKGIGNSLDFGSRIYDSRIGRWLSLDPLARQYPSISPYAFAANNPIYYLDPDGRKIFPTQAFMSSSWGKVYVELSQKNNVFKQTIKMYDHPDNDYTLDHNLKSYNDDPLTTRATTTVDKYAHGIFKATSNFNVPQDPSDNRAYTKIGMAAVIIHEAIHAGYLGPKGEETGRDHNNFANKYQSKYHDALKEYNADNGNKYSKDQIEALSWQGLEGTDAFDNYISGKAQASGKSKDLETHIWRKTVEGIMLEPAPSNNAPDNTNNSSPNQGNK
jgi:RHS repeat-associated protein